MSQINIVENKSALLIDVFNDDKINRVMVISDIHIGNSYWLQNRDIAIDWYNICLLYTSPSPRDRQKSRMPSSA